MAVTGTVSYHRPILGPNGAPPLEGASPVTINTRPVYGFRLCFTLNGVTDEHVAAVDAVPGSQLIRTDQDTVEAWFTFGPPPPEVTTQAAARDYAARNNVTETRRLLQRALASVDDEPTVNDGAALPDEGAAL